MQKGKESSEDILSSVCVLVIMVYLRYETTWKEYFFFDRSAVNTTSSWPILLYSMATEAAKIESEWKDAFDGYKKLSQIYKVRKDFELSGLCHFPVYMI